MEPFERLKQWLMPSLNSFYLICNTKHVKNFCSILHNRKIRVWTHDDTHTRCLCNVWNKMQQNFSQIHHDVISDQEKANGLRYQTMLNVNWPCTWSLCPLNIHCNLLSRTPIDCPTRVMCPIFLCFLISDNNNLSYRTKKKLTTHHERTIREHESNLACHTNAQMHLEHSELSQ